MTDSTYMSPDPDLQELQKKFTMKLNIEIKFKVKYYDPHKETSVEENCESFTFSGNRLDFYTDDPIHKSHTLHSVDSYMISMSTEWGLVYSFRGYQYIPHRGGYDVCEVKITPIKEDEK